jgi:mycofactocin system glycosyltransferase
VTGLPEGFRIDLDRSVRTFRDSSVLVGGHPGRMLTLSDAGRRSLRRLIDTGPTTTAERRLGRRLVDAGMAHPRPADPSRPPDRALTLTVVVPVRDRPELLDRCLASLGDGVPVVVVDDASADPDPVAAVCRAHGAKLHRRQHNGGPAAARNDGLSVTESDLVAFVDSDCTVPDRWLDGLRWHFADPVLGAVAPRIRPDPPTSGTRSTALARYSAARSALDMGSDESDVGPLRPVRYLPTAALVVRRSAVPGGFDPDLRVGEDVDLVWRMLTAGWRVHFDPAVEVSHLEPSGWAGLLARRFRYGTSAGPLSARHPGRLAPVELRPWPTVATLAALSGRWTWAAALLAVPAATTASTVRGAGIPARMALGWTAESAAWTFLGVGRAATTLAAPAVLGAVLMARTRRQWRSTTAMAGLLLGPPLVDWARRRPALDPIRWCVASVVDDATYGAGVWAGCLRSRRWEPLLPRLRRGPAGS